MHANLRQWMYGITIANPIQRRQAFVVQGILIALLPLVLIGLLINVAIPGQEASKPIAIASNLLVLPLLVYALVLLRQGRFQPAVLLTVVGQIVAITGVLFPSGLKGSAALILAFMAPITLAGLLLGRRGLLSMIGLTIVLVLTIGALEHLTPPLAGFDPLDGDPTGTIIATFLLVVSVIGVFLDRFGSALRDALAAALAREQELQHLRASLETQVVERTTDLQEALAEVQSRAETQARLLDEVAQQRVLIQELSVPVIPVNTTTLVLPLVGTLDSTRLNLLQEQALAAIENSSARRLVIDITGVPVVDSQVAQALVAVINAARLLGAQTALVGIRPEVAQALVGLGLGMEGMYTFRDLQSALNRMPSVQDGTVPSNHVARAVGR